MVDWVRAPTKNPAPTAKRSLVLGLDHRMTKDPLAERNHGLLG
jgi:hypothetical protein